MKLTHLYPDHGNVAHNSDNKVPWKRTAKLTLHGRIAVEVPPSLALAKLPADEVS